MFFQRTEYVRKTILIVYVVDIIMSTIWKIERLEKTLVTRFEIKDIRQMRYFLGIEVERSKRRLSVSQRKYVLDLLNETRILDVNQATIQPKP